MKIMIILSLIFIFIFLIFCYWTDQILKNMITDKKAIAAIVGEYAKLDLYGMKIYAHAIRNRGTLKGVYGVNAKHNKTETGYIWELAKRAWEESEHEADTSNGADSWYNDKDIEKWGHPKNKMRVKIYGNTSFYKTTNKKTGGSK